MLSDADAFRQETKNMNELMKTPYDMSPEEWRQTDNFAMNLYIAWDRMSDKDASGEWDYTGEDYANFFYAEPAPIRNLFRRLTPDELPPLYQRGKETFRKLTGRHWGECAIPPQKETR